MRLRSVYRWSPATCYLVNGDRVLDGARHAKARRSAETIRAGQPMMSKWWFILGGGRIVALLSGHHLGV
jgi:hypothetical protein